MLGKIKKFLEERSKKESLPEKYFEKTEEFFEKINSYKYIDLLALKDDRYPSLHLFIAECIVSDEERVIDGDLQLSGQPIEVTDQSNIYEVIFQDYIAYSVLNESYAQKGDYHLYEGDLFRIYSQSHYLDYVKKDSFASDDYPGPFKHYGFICGDHVIDIVSTEPPIVKQINGHL